MTTWTADTWCACPKCNGPSFPVDEAASPGPRDLVCHACDHEWTGAGRQFATALAMAKHRAADWEDDGAPFSREEVWAVIIDNWKARALLERERMARAMRGEW